MGCDIHAFYEVKVKGNWHMYKQSSATRDYLSFAILAGVRNSSNVLPISAPRGLPADVSVGTKLYSDDYGIDGHSHSYLRQREFDLFDRMYGSARVIMQNAPRENAALKRSFIYQDDMTPDLIELPEGVEDIRLVFFFDN